MFEYTKQILQKVSFDKKLFRKELVKALKWLKPDEKKMLMVWALANFGNKYTDIISQVFKKMA
ncbi:MAG TPA: hypothetical protein PLO59_09320 [Bacteroidia bacterium]|nr:hypothetical protein [Bacteroidia bacterium]